MMFGLFRRSSNEAVIDRLYTAIVEASRAPVLYASLGVPDTFEGRFESLTLHVVLVMRRLQGCEAPGPEMAQHLIDTTFRHFDRTLREMGVGDTSVPKRMKRMAEAFLGRRAAYEAAMTEGGDGLVPALARNMLPSRVRAEAFAPYVAASVAGLETQPLQAFVDGDVAFADPAAYVREIVS